MGGRIYMLESKRFLKIKNHWGWRNGLVSKHVRCMSMRTGVWTQAPTQQDGCGPVADPFTQHWEGQRRGISGSVGCQPLEETTWTTWAPGSVEILSQRNKVEGIRGGHQMPCTGLHVCSYMCPPPPRLYIPNTSQHASLLMSKVFGCAMTTLCDSIHWSNYSPKYTLISALAFYLLSDRPMITYWLYIIFIKNSLYLILFSHYFSGWKLQAAYRDWSWPTCQQAIFIH